jgi:hypothetical protein
MKKDQLKVLIWISSISLVIGIGLSIYAYFEEESSMGNLAGAVLAIVGFIGTMVTLIVLTQEKDRPAIQLDFNTATQLADKILKEEIDLRDKAITALKRDKIIAIDYLKTNNHVSKESKPINRNDIGLVKTLSIVGLIIISLVGLSFSLRTILYYLDYSLNIGEKVKLLIIFKYIRYSFFFFIRLFTLYAIFQSMAVIKVFGRKIIVLLWLTFSVVWLLNLFVIKDDDLFFVLLVLLGIAYSIIWIKKSNNIAKEYNFDIKEILKQFLTKYKKFIIIFLFGLLLIFYLFYPLFRH